MSERNAMPMPALTPPLVPLEQGSDSFQPGPLYSTKLVIWLPVLLSIACGVAIGWSGYTARYFPQNDVFSYYQLFHLTYSSILFAHQIPLWEPYTSYGFPSAFELAFTFGPSKVMAALLGLLLGITNIKALYFGAVGFDFALLGLVSAWLVRDLTGREGPHLSFAAVVMPVTHYMETLPTCGYGFALTMLFVVLFLLRFLRTRNGLYLTGAALALAMNIYGNPQYLVIPEVYIALLFLVLAGLRYRTELLAGWRNIVRSLFAPPSLILAALTVVLAVGLFLIDRETFQTVEFTTRLRDQQTLVPTLQAYLYYLYVPPGNRVVDLFTGRTLTSFDVWLYFGASGFAMLMFTFAFGWRIRFVPELLILVFLTTLFSLPALPVAKWAYYYAPGMKLYRPTIYASMFAKPFAILAIACMLASPRLLEEPLRPALAFLAGIVTLAAAFTQRRAIPVTLYFDSFSYGWIAIAGALALCLATVAGGMRYWRRWAPLLLTLVLSAEVVAHRVAFELHFYDALAMLHPENSPSNAVLVEPWYKWPRQLTYQPARIPNPPLAAHFEPIGSLYHGMWTFLGIDPCMPGTRSDTYVKWIAEGLKGRGATLMNLETGQLIGLGSGFSPAYGCNQPKLTINDPEGLARVKSFTPNTVSIEVATTVGGTLTYRDAWTPDWRASLDGRSVKLDRNLDGFKVISLPAGTHHVELTYEPLVKQWVLALLAVVLALSLVAELLLASRNAKPLVRTN